MYNKRTTLNLETKTIKYNQPMFFYNYAEIILKTNIRIKKTQSLHLKYISTLNYQNIKIKQQQNHKC